MSELIRREEEHITKLGPIGTRKIQNNVGDVFYLQNLLVCISCSGIRISCCYITKYLTTNKLTNQANYSKLQECEAFRLDISI